MNRCACGHPAGLSGLCEHCETRRDSFAPPAGSARGGSHYRNGVARWTVCYCGMQMVEGKTCSVCGYKCEPPNDEALRPLEEKQ